MKILLVDDHILFREGLASLLNSQPDLTVAGFAETVQDAVVKASQLQPDLILMDFGLSDGTGLDATRIILDKYPYMKIIFLTMHEDDEPLFEAIRCGAKGYLLKNVPVAKLLSYIRGVENGEAAISRSMTTRVLNQFSQTKPLRAPTLTTQNVLTAREIEILRELDTGATNRQIANRLVISERTVKNHVSNILSKLSLKNRREAANFARQHGLVGS
ncbi:MAG: response regulator transcription factor [Chloroflexi bacterium]|nr:response regulator transcription factor [Chloroflexota bacterium]